MAGDTIALNTERVVLQVPTQRNTCCHQGGSMTFDTAGNLYLATGDNTNPFEADGFAPIDERAGRQDYDAQRTSGNTNDLRGKIIRIRPAADGTYTVPAGNLFAPGTANTRPEIYAMGFRNPFRIGLDRQTNTLLVADYGPDAQAANPNRGPEGTVEWNIVRPGNYGWPYCMGANQAFNDWTFPSGPSGAKFNCAAPVNNSPNNTGLPNLPAAVGATVDYDFSGNPLFPEIGGGGAPMAGPVYRYNAALVSDRKWPAYYDGKAIFGEWNQNKLYTFQVNSAVTSVVDINQLLPSMSFKRPMDMEFGPDGALYLIEWGSRVRRQQRRLRRLPHRLHLGWPGADRRGQRHADHRPGAVDRPVLQRRLPGPGRPGHHVRVDVRRRHRLHGGQPVAHVHDRWQLQRAARRHRHRGPHAPWPTCRSAWATPRPR